LTDLASLSKAVPFRFDAVRGFVPTA